MPFTAERAERRDVWHENVTAIRRVPRSEWPLPGDGAPVVVMAASGGGSRAAIYTAYTFERLHRDLPDVAVHLQAVSSVSGGSLASAAYVARRFNWGGRFGEWVAALPADVEPGELVEAMSQDFLLPTIAGALSPFSTRCSPAFRASCGRCIACPCRWRRASGRPSPAWRRTARRRRGRGRRSR